jgi:hypothetical protein
VKKWRKWKQGVRRVARVLRAPFIGPEEEGSGQAVGGGECSFKAMVFKDGMGEEEVR